MLEGVHVYQIESRTLHFHSEGGKGHVLDMTRVAASVVHGSFLCPDALKSEIEAELERLGALEPGEPIERLDGILRCSGSTSIPSTRSSTSASVRRPSRPFPGATSDGHLAP